MILPVARRPWTRHRYPAVFGPVVTHLMLLCCVNPFGGKGGGTPRSVFGRFSGVKGCCAIAARRPGPPLTPEPRWPLWAAVGRPGPARAVRGVPPPTMVDVPVRLLGLGAQRRGDGRLGGRCSA